jgi:hypothetical protein
MVLNIKGRPPQIPDADKSLQSPWTIRKPYRIQAPRSSVLCPLPMFDPNKARLIMARPACPRTNDGTSWDTIVHLLHAVSRAWPLHTRFTFLDGLAKGVILGHCRRRKIRCIPSPADMQGRCVNCIRLKKECSFYPVDQQPPPDTRSKVSSRSSAAPKLTSASSSPPMASGHSSDMAPHSYLQLTLPPQSMPPPGLKASASDLFSQDAKCE